MIYYRATTAGLIRAVSTVAFTIGISVLVQAQDVVIHVPVSQPRLLEVEAGQDKKTEDPAGVLLGEDMEVKGGTPEYGYRWTGPDSQAHVGEKWTATSFGNYYLTVTDQKNCTAVDSVRISGPTATGTEKTPGPIALYPNPTTGNIYFDGSGFGETIRAEVMDVSGKVIHRQQVPNYGNSGTRTLQLGHLPEGTYLVRLSDGSESRTGHIRVH